MQGRSRKFSNLPDQMVDQMIAGFVGAHPDRLEVAPGSGRAIYARRGPRDGKVSVVIGGGSGHEPSFIGFVGAGLADAAVLGNIFASPSPRPILEAAHVTDRDAGTLLLFGNHSGDVLNFGLALEELVGSGKAAASVSITDDLASSSQIELRRGVAGGLLVLKIAGAAADRMLPLSEVHRLASLANDRTRSIGVALGSCTLPHSNRPNFEVAEGEMAFGVGLHGEAGLATVPFSSADDTATRLVDAIATDHPLLAGDEVAVLLNGLGATSVMELYVLQRRILEALAEREVKVAVSHVGPFVTSLDMPGVSLSLMKLDDELKDLMSHPCESTAFNVRGPVTLTARPDRSEPPSAAKRIRRPDAETPIRSNAAFRDGDVAPVVFRSMMSSIAGVMSSNADWLCELDGDTGDGDHGIAMRTGWVAIEREILGLPPEVHVNELSLRMAQVFLDAVGASSGPLYATGLADAGIAVADRTHLDGEGMAAWLDGMAKGIARRGGASLGDKTMLDVWLPVARAALHEVTQGRQAVEILNIAAEVAEVAMRDTANLVARRGRSSKAGDRSRGRIDPGAASAYLIVQAMADIASPPDPN